MKTLILWSGEKKDEMQKRLSPIRQRVASFGVELQFVSTLNNVSVMPGTVLAMGTDKLKRLQEAGVLKKNVSLNKSRCQVFDLPTGHKAMTTYTTIMQNIDYGTYVLMLSDVVQAARLAATGSISPDGGDYSYVTDLRETVDAIESGLGPKNYPVAFDLETIGFDEFRAPSAEHPGAHIVTAQFSYKPGHGVAVYFPQKQHEKEFLADNYEELGRPMEWLLNNQRLSVRGNNLKFDMRWLEERTGITCTNFRFDNTMVGCLLDENRSNALDLQTKLFVPGMAGYSDEFDRSVDKGRMDLIDKEQLLPYAVGDTDAALQVSYELEKQLVADPHLTAFYVNLLHPSARTFEAIERGGVVLDMDAYKDLEFQLREECQSAIVEARRCLGGTLFAKHQDPKKEFGINITKASLLNDFLFSPMGLNLHPKMTTAKSGAPSTAMEHLNMFIDHKTAGPFIEQVARFSSASKMLSTYVYGFQEHIRPDGRFHPTYWLFAGNRDAGEGGTVTGRLSCRDPAFQTIPKHSKWGKILRRCFPAPDGFVVSEADYSQGELRVAACIANEKNMIQAYLDDMDLHAITASETAGYTYEEMMALKKSDKEAFSALRQLGKAGNFGLLYGMGVDGFTIYAKTTYGVDLTRKEAEAFRNGFFAKYPSLTDYHKEYKDFARKNGYVRSPLGRKRHLPMANSTKQDLQAQALRQAINSPVQGVLSDMMIWSISRFEQAGGFKSAPCFGVIHDASYNYLPEDTCMDWGLKIKQSMESLPFETLGWHPQLNFPADVKIGPSMGEMDEIDF